MKEEEQKEEEKKEEKEKRKTGENLRPHGTCILLRERPVINTINEKTYGMRNGKICREKQGRGNVLLAVP